MDRNRILKRLERGKLNAEEAEELLAKVEFADFLAAAGKAKALRIKMEETKTKKVLWEETMPISKVKLGLKMGNKIWNDAVKKYPELKDFDFNYTELYARLTKEEPGSVTTLVSRDGAKQLHVWLE